MANILEVVLDLTDNLSSGLDSVASNVDNLANSVENASTSIDSMSTSGFADVEAAALGAGLDIQSIGEAAASAGLDINNISPTPIKETASSANSASAGMKELNESTNLVEGAMAALVSVGIVTFLESAADAAGTFTDNWERIGIVMDENGASVEQLQAKYGGSIASMRDTTGRGLGQIQNSIINLGIAGIENQDILTQSFDAISGMAFIKNGGKDIDSVAAAYTRMVQSGTIGTRQLIQLGVGTEGANEALKGTGMTLDDLKKKFPEMSAEARAAYLNMILNSAGAAEGNRKFKESWVYVKLQMSLAFDYINRVVGGLILPVIIPIVEQFTRVVKWLGDGLSSLQGPAKNVAGVLIVVVGSIAALVGGIIGANAFLGLLGTSLWAIGEGLAAVLVSLGPVGWAILAITAAVITGIYVWQNWSNEIIRFKNLIMTGDWGSAADMIGNMFIFIGSSVETGLRMGWDYLVNYITNLPAMIGTSSGTFIEIGGKVLDWIITGLTSLSGKLTTVLNNMLSNIGTGGGGGAGGIGASTGNAILDGLIAWGQANGGKIAVVLANLLMKALPLLGTVILQMGAILVVYFSQMSLRAGQSFLTGLITWLSRLPGLFVTTLVGVSLALMQWIASLTPMGLLAGSNLVNSFIGYVSSLPGQLWGILGVALGTIMNFAGQSIGQMAAAGYGMVNGLASGISGLPGIVWRELNAIASAIMSAGGSLYGYAVSLGQQIVAGLMAGLNQHSPGDMYKAIVNELGWMEGALNNNNLPILAGNLGMNISRAFNPSLNGSTNPGGMSSSTGMIGSNNPGPTYNIFLLEWDDWVNQVRKANNELERGIIP